MRIHPTAVVSPKAELAEDVAIGAFCMIGPEVVIESGSRVREHAVIDGKTRIGKNCEIFPFVSIGLAPQDITYGGEPTCVDIGDDNIIREYVSIHRGSHRGDGVTRMGKGCFIMAYAHIAHDCRVGDRVIMANAGTLGGHVEVGDAAVIGGMVAIHQFVRVGEYSCIGGFCGVRMDIAPYMLVAGADPPKLHGPNIIGLRRNGFSSETISAIKKCHRIIFRSGLTVADAVEKTRAEVEAVPEVERLIEFVCGSKRGLTR